ncbi:hypothetical protein HOLleu_16120 [Holothuria leucospilota]|uniref:Reverse transcriptase domain-containing protein n=1 Tax=Holothuria leucospilota TaxID=206669 RepID=A0A9Q1HA57_HOLLE|nr:hypothetical protein HOLleu_16120 [Holothuria leucospilota]
MLREGDIEEKTAEYLVTNDVRASRFYTLPKTHKAKDEKGHLKIRPVIWGNGSPIERLSEFVDFFINPEMQKLDSFIKYTRDFLKVIYSINQKGPLDSKVAMFTIDVKAMFPNIPQHLGIEGARRALKTRLTKIPSTENLIECIRICLEENHFEFYNEFYTLIHGGTSIGPKMAPAYACLGMGLVEEKLWEESTVKPTEWCRFIDDIWGLWPHGKDSFISFMQILNNLYPNESEFSYVFDYKTITFLDVCIKRTGQGYLDNDLYVKPSFKNLYLHYDSYHSRHTLDRLWSGFTYQIHLLIGKGSSKKFRDFRT